MSNIITPGGIISAGRELLPGVSWRLVETPPPIDTPMDIAYGDGLFIESTSSAVFLKSVDGLSWWPMASPGDPMDPSDWLTIVYGNGRFVTLGEFASGQSGYATDARSFTDGGPLVVCRRSAYGAGLFVGVAESGEIVTSPTAVTWTSRTPPASAVFWSDICMGVDGFLAVAQSGVIRSAVSDNGILWSAGGIDNSKGWKECVFGAGKYVVINDVGDIAHRYMDETSQWVWSYTTSPITKGLCFGAGLFVGNDGINFYYSSDAITWHMAKMEDFDEFSVMFPSRMAYGNGMFVGIRDENGNIWVSGTPEQGPFGFALL